MPINTGELISVIADLSRNEGIKACVTGSVRGGVFTGVGAAVGGVLLGPLGVIAGGLFGGMTAVTTGRNFKPIAEIIMNDLTPSQRAILVSRVNNVIKDIGPQDAIQLGAIMMSNSSLRQAVLSVVTDFVRNDLNLQLM